MSSHLSDTHIYLDLQIVNNNQNNNEPPPVLRFEETRNSPFLPGDRADYFLCLVCEKISICLFFSRTQQLENVFF